MLTVFHRAGHNIALRHGFVLHKKKKNQHSPIIIQFLDCVHQIWTQFPEEFEFNLQLLKELGFYSYGGFFGNFIFSNEKERHS